MQDRPVCSSNNWKERPQISRVQGPNRNRYKDYKEWSHNCKKVAKEICKYPMSVLWHLEIVINYNSNYTKLKQEWRCWSNSWKTKLKAMQGKLPCISWKLLRRMPFLMGFPIIILIIDIYGILFCEKIRGLRNSQIFLVW